MVFTEARLAGAWPGYGGRLGIDATFKDGYPRPLEMRADIVERVDSPVERVLELKPERPPLTDLVRERRALLRDPALTRIADKLLAGERLDLADGLAVLGTADVPGAGLLADAVARDRHGDRVYFTVNRQLNPTNVCVLACRFCDYAKKPGAPGRVHDDEGAGPRARGPRDHRDPHRRRPAQQVALRRLPETSSAG